MVLAVRTRCPLGDINQFGVPNTVIKLLLTMRTDQSYQFHFVELARRGFKVTDWTIDIVVGELMGEGIVTGGTTDHCGWALSPSHVTSFECTMGFGDG